jgi:hypothetical protein
MITIGWELLTPVHEEKTATYLACTFRPVGGWCGFASEHDKSHADGGTSSRGWGVANVMKAAIIQVEMLWTCDSTPEYPSELTIVDAKSAVAQPEVVVPM